MNTQKSKPLFLVSACLMGLCTRYDGKLKNNKACQTFLKETIWIPVCPEQLGGLPTPRAAADITTGDGHDVLKGATTVCTEAGEDLSQPFIKGANQVLQIAKSHEIDGICLKSRSPSCAVSGTIGVTAALLQQNGFRLYEF